MSGWIQAAMQQNTIVVSWQFGFSRQKLVNQKASYFYWWQIFLQELLRAWLIMKNFTISN